MKTTVNVSYNWHARKLHFNPRHYKPSRRPPIATETQEQHSHETHRSNSSEADKKNTLGARQQGIRSVKHLE